MNYKMNTKSMTEGAILAAIGAGLAMIGYYIPFLSIASALWAAPIIICGYRNGIKVSVVSTVVAGLLVAILISPVTALNLILTFGIPGIVMGYLMKKGKSSITTVLVGAALLAIGLIVTFVLGFAIVGMDARTGMESMAKEFAAIVTAMKPTIIELYTRAGMTKKDIDLIISQMEMMFDMLRMLLPVILISCGVIYSYVNFKLSVIVFKRMNIVIADLPPFALWRFPSNFSMGLLASVLVVMAAVYLKIPGIETAMVNIYMLAVYALTVLGLSITCFYLNRGRVSKGLRIIIMAVALLFFQRFLFTAGLVDTIFNFRKRTMDKAGGI